MHTGAISQLKADFCFSRPSKTTSTTFAGFPAGLDTPLSRGRESDWIGRESSLSEIDFVGNALHPNDHHSSGRFTIASSVSEATHMNYDAWGEDELTVEISRLHSTDHRQVLQDL